MEADRKSRSSQRSSQRGSTRSRRRKRRRKPWGERVLDWSRALIAFLFSNVGIVCLVVGYTIAGAFLFTHIEGKTSSDVAGDVIALRNLTAATLWELTSKVKDLYARYTAVAAARGVGMRAGCPRGYICVYAERYMDLTFYNGFLRESSVDFVSSVRRERETVAEIRIIRDVASQTSV